MPVGYLSIRIDSSRRDHHLWLNNGTWWCHYTLHFDGRKRRIRRSLRTRDLERAIALRDELFAHIREHGEFVAPRRREGDGPRRMRLIITGDSVQRQLCVLGA